MTDTQEIKFPVTTKAADWVANLNADDIPDRAYDFAKHAILDCIGCIIAGRDDPAMKIMYAEFADDDSGGPCTLIGVGTRTSLHNAALINGTGAHALDYDDVHFRLHGHPTACIAPAVLALGEYLGASGRDVLTAFIVGTEVACALGDMSDDGHYEAGFHATGTMGTFGAAAACARLMGLDAETTTHALGIAASQAAGLKANFGTMTKPLHAGKAAMNGLIAARLAARGFTANDVAIEGANGFAATQVPGFDGMAIRPDAGAIYAVEEILYKHHAACFLTHSTLNAIQVLRDTYNIGLDDVESASLKVRSTHSSVCCIPEPDTGLGVKFSIQHLAAMGLAGVDTSALEAYSDENANDPRFVAARKNMHLDYTEGMRRPAAVVSLTMKDGRQLVEEHDVGVPDADERRQWHNLSAKFSALVSPVLGDNKSASLVDSIAGLDGAKDVRELITAAG